MKRIKKIIKNPFILIHYLGIKEKLNFIPDKYYLKLIFRIRMNKKLNLKEPVTFNEKLQYLKLYDRNPMYTKLVDKYEVREYIAETIGNEYLVPLLGVWDSFEDIDFSKLPQQFVLKTTHDSGGVVVCKDKGEFDIKSARKKINRSLKRNYFYAGREWPYKNVKPKIICEQYLESEVGLQEYKFFCFNGVPKLLFVASDRDSEPKFDFYDLDFNRLKIKNHYKNSKDEMQPPANFDKMIELSTILSERIPHVRVDFYNINGKIYFGELTFYHFSGLVPFIPEEVDNKLGNLIQLPDI